MLTYCVKQKKKTACQPGSERFLVTKNGRNAMKCICSECGATKFRFLKGHNGEGLGDILGTFTGSLLKSGKDQMGKVYATAPQYQLYRLLGGQDGEGILSSIGEMAVEGAIKAAPYVAKTAFNTARDVSSHFMRDPKLQQKAINYALKKGRPLIDEAGSAVINKLADAVSTEGFIKGKYARKNSGGAVDIHKAIGKLPKPKGGWTLPGHRYTGPYNDLDRQVRFDPKTGEILEIYDPPTGKTDAIAMQHDVDYSVCGDNKKCKHLADRKMVKSLDAVPWNERQWGHWLARNMINTKQKVGLGTKKVKKKRPKINGKRS